MKTDSELLTTDLWKTAAKLAGRAGTRQAAIAYVTSEKVSFGKGDLLIVDATVGAITSGQTTAGLLLAARKRGALVYSCSDLHAKVMVLDDAALIGSANLTGNSEGYLHECAVLTRQPALVGQARAFLQQLRELGEPLSVQTLEKLAALPVVRSNFGKQSRKPRPAPIGKRRWIIGLTPIEDEDMTDDDTRTVARGQRKLEKKLGEAREGLSWMRMRGKSKMREEAAVGDRVIVVNGAHIKTNRLHIEPPHTILSREVGTDSTFFYYDDAETRRLPLGKTDFVKLTGEAGLDVKPSPRMARELPVEAFDKLDKKWPK